MATLARNLDSIIAHMRGVVDAVADEAEERAARIRAVAAAHQRSGRFYASIKTAPRGPDTLIYSDDPAALSINYGHRAPDGRMVPGIHAFEAGLT
ncbi:DUF5403 family protein [Streptomyces hoynatensis]|uniref:HK97 gp10 family phage protein n=1 Tax=Streptomyces hoynatensis TaxID=1141874 RepID=A0A3A9YYL7_9ACTN|nr:DUF5403 family protein [Streptomyces hoynatensis]RKN40804.1 hypothetical protein D7294_17110 [Streptomyces hoynatensis]